MSADSMSTITPEQQAALRAPFPPELIGKLPKAGTTLDYVGHADVTDRLLQVDPCWSWEPMSYGDDGAPCVQRRGDDAVLWLRLTVCGVTRIGVGIVAAKSFELEKQLISDALRNAAMRYGVALDLWSKHEQIIETTPRRRSSSSRSSSSSSSSSSSTAGESASASKRPCPICGESLTDGSPLAKSATHGMAHKRCAKAAIDEAGRAAETSTPEPAEYAPGEEPF
jgi:hypothetical protein